MNAVGVAMARFVANGGAVRMGITRGLGFHHPRENAKELTYSKRRVLSHGME